MTAIIKEPMLMPSIDIETFGQPTLYLDDKAVMDDLSKTLCIGIMFAIISKILRENGK